MTNTPVYLRDQAKQLRHMAEAQPDADLRRELLDLADRCERLAREMSTNGHAVSQPGG